MEPEALAQALVRIEYAARVSHRSEDETALNTERFIRAVVLNHGDWSVVEHVSASVEFLVDRGITHEIVRHRIASYTQESTRFVNYAKKMPPTFIYPKPDEECCWCLKGLEPENNGDGWRHYDENDKPFSDCSYEPYWLTAIDEAEHAYRELLSNGWSPQEARSVFPNALSSKIVVSMNIRSWRHFFLMRTTKEAHPQMRQVTIPLLAEFQKLVPVLFEDIAPEARQVANIAKGR
ncbi:FAD-dependent thymidylate synthase [Acidobacteria bacterium AB60]|nr:FAD-dependent thymidylate synthase [Acidobacteria bacterium AB60]